MDQPPSRLLRNTEGQKASPGAQGQLVALRSYLVECQAKSKSSHEDLTSLRIAREWGGSSFYHVNQFAAGYWLDLVNEAISSKAADIKVLETAMRKTQESIAKLENMNAPLVRTEYIPSQNPFFQTDATPSPLRSAPTDLISSNRERQPSLGGQLSYGDDNRVAQEELPHQQLQAARETPHLHQAIRPKPQSVRAPQTRLLSPFLERQIEQALATPFEEAFPNHTDQYLSNSGILKHVPIKLARIQEPNTMSSPNNGLITFDEGIKTFGLRHKKRATACWVDHLGGVDPNQIVHEYFNVSSLNDSRLLTIITNHMTALMAVHDVGEMVMKPIHFYQWRLSLASDKTRERRRERGRATSAQTIITNIQYKKKFFYDEVLDEIYKRGKELRDSREPEMKRARTEDSGDDEHNDDRRDADCTASQQRRLC
ncbi:Fc.00g001580.m01.CDS01 [Cosmosporella sp. VM-42]